LTNLVRGKGSRKAPTPGDIFALQLPSGQYLFGRVILVDPPRSNAPMPGSILIYIYRTQSTSKELEGLALTPDQLLIPPLWTNRQAWTRGYFSTLTNVPLRTDDLLLDHCFLAWDSYRTLKGERISARTEPCGVWGLVSYRWIDDQVSDAVGIPRVPVLPGD